MARHHLGPRVRYPAPKPGGRGSRATCRPPASKCVEGETATAEGFNVADDKKLLHTGQKVRVRCWDRLTRTHVAVEAVLDHYCLDGRCWYFARPCPVVWADADDITPEERP